MWLSEAALMNVLYWAGIEGEDRQRAAEDLIWRLKILTWLSVVWEARWKGSITVLVKEDLCLFVLWMLVCYPQLSCVYFAAPVSI